jgi:taurine transport system substrate-binding protein
LFHGREKNKAYKIRGIIMQLRRITAGVIILTVTAVIFAGCGNSKKPAETAGPKVVNIGTQQMPNDEKLAIEKGFLEEELGVKVNIIEFQAGEHSPLL